MTDAELYHYQMSAYETEVWDMLKTAVLTDFGRMGIPTGFENVIHRLMKSGYGSHWCGYSVTDGYFYIYEGDRGGIASVCRYSDSDDMRWLVLESTAREAGQKLELSQRKCDEKNWRWLRRFNRNGENDDIEQSGYIYNTVHDTRKFWMEYEIRALSKVFSGEKINDLIREYVDSMNYWFDVPHWGFDYEKLCFIEISDSREKG